MALRDSQDALIFEQPGAAGHLRDTQSVLLYELPLLPTKNQIVGGNFQDGLGRRLANGSVLMELSVDSAKAGNQILSGLALAIPLDGEGNVSGTVNVWPNDVVSPTGTYYKVSVFAADGTKVWKHHHNQTILSAPTPYNIGNWVPS